MAKSLVDQDHAELNQKLNGDAARLKLNPEASLWSGIEYKFRPRQQIPQHPDGSVVQPPTQNQPTMPLILLRGNNRTPVSPLTNIDHTQAVPNQIFQSAWGQMGRRQSRGGGMGRQRPYNQSQLWDAHTRIPRTQTTTTKGTTRTTTTRTRAYAAGVAGITTHRPETTAQTPMRATS